MKLLPDKVYAREILKLAAPAITGLSSQMVVSLVNTAMVGRLENSHIQLAAMGLGLLGTWALTSFFSSFSTGTHVLTARRHGEGNFAGVGQVLNNSLIISFVLGTIFGILGYFLSTPLMDFFAKDSTVAQVGAEYMKFQFLGLPFFLLTVSYRGFFYGIGHTKVFMQSAIIINVFNILFNYLFIFGAFGFPKMELAGAGIGSTLSLILGWFFFIGVTFMKEYRKQYGYFSGLKISKDIIAQIVKISIPVSLQNIFILLGFLVFLAITGIIGVMEQAASQVVITALFISMMPCFGLGIATQTFVGQSIGKGDKQSAHRYGFEAAKIGTIFTILVGLLFILLPDAVIILITTNDEVTEIARPVLQVAGVAQMLYGAGIVYANALQAGGATLYVMMVELITHWILFLPLAYFFAIGLGGGIIGAWMALPVYVLFFTLLNFTKFRSFEWLHNKI